MTDLEKEIEALTAKHEADNSILKLLPDFKTMGILHNSKALGTSIDVHVNLFDMPLIEIKAAIAKVIEVLPPTQNYLTRHKKENDTETASPFLLYFKNTLNDSKYNMSHVIIRYISGKHHVHIKLPVKYYSDDVKGVFMRKVSDTEHHYFGGVSMAEIRRMQIPAYKLDMFDSVTWYGGDVTSYIIDDHCKEEFESVVLTGHIPEFAEFWQEQLIEL